MNSIVRRAQALTRQRSGIPERRSDNRKSPAPAQLSVKTVQPPAAPKKSKLVRQIWVSFVFCVLLPSILSAFYFFGIASKRYVAEGHFVIRGAEQFDIFDGGGITMNLVRSFTGGSVSSSMQDAYIVADYVESRSIVRDLRASVDLDEIYGSNDIDFLSRMTSSPTLDEAWLYWRKRVSAYVDSNSGIIQIKVQAFSPEMAQSIAKKIGALSEALINRLTERSLRDAVDRATAEARKAWDDYSAAEAKLSSFRTASNTLDPVETAGSIGKVLLGLYEKRANMRASLDSIDGQLSPDSPNVRLLQNDIDAISKQIKRLEDEVAGADNSKSLTATLADYEKLQIDVMFKKRMYEMNALAVEKARASAIKKNLFLNVVVPPSLPEEAAYPQSAFNVFFTLLSSFVFWAIGLLMVAAVRDHM